MQGCIKVFKAHSNNCDLAGLLHATHVRDGSNEIWNRESEWNKF